MEHELAITRIRSALRRARASAPTRPGWWLVTMLAVALVACSGSTPAGRSASPTAAATDSPARAQDADVHFRLVFALPKTTWRATEAIEGTATLTLVDPGSMTVMGSGSGLLGFEFDQVGGDKHVSWVRTADCGPHGMRASEPIVAAISKTVAYSTDAAPTDFYRVFGTDPLIHLPAGDWTIAAVTWFAEGQDCGGPIHALRAMVLLHVTG